MAVNWNALAQAPNAGLAFSDAFQRAQQLREQKALQAQQMAEHQQDRQFRQQQMQSQQHQAYIEQNRENILRGAQIIRQVQPKDQASWDQARALAQQAGVDVSQVPPQFDPQYVQGISALADALAPQKQAEAPSSVREYEYAKQNGFGGSYTDFQQYIHPPSALTIPYGSSVSGGAPSGATATGPNGEKVQYNPQSGQWEPLGGTGGNVGGGFR